MIAFPLPYLPVCSVEKAFHSKAFTNHTQDNTIVLSCQYKNRKSFLLPQRERITDIAERTKLQFQTFAIAWYWLNPWISTSTVEWPEYSGPECRPARGGGGGLGGWVEKKIRDATDSSRRLRLLTRSQNSEHR